MTSLFEVSAIQIFILFIMKLINVFIINEAVLCSNLDIRRTRPRFGGIHSVSRDTPRLHKFSPELPVAGEGTWRSCSSHIRPHRTRIQAKRTAAPPCNFPLTHHKRNPICRHNYLSRIWKFKNQNTYVQGDPDRFDQLILRASTSRAVSTQ